MIKYSFYRKDQPLFEQRIDITDLLKERGWKSISAAEAMEISKIHFGITFGKYALMTDDIESQEYRLQADSWKTYDEDGFRIGFSTEDLAIIRNKRIDSLF
jgi:hypothetical protein